MGLLRLEVRALFSRERCLFFQLLVTVEGQQARPRGSFLLLEDSLFVLLGDQVVEKLLQLLLFLLLQGVPEGEIEEEEVLVVVVSEIELFELVVFGQPPRVLLFVVIEVLRVYFAG